MVVAMVSMLLTACGIAGGEGSEIGDTADYIFDAASGGLVYAAPAFDLTPHIIELMGTGNDEPDLPQAP